MTKTELFIHCLATPNDFMIGRPVHEVVDTVTRWHKERGWKAIGYAGVIHRDGALGGGRDLDGDGDFLEERGAHAKGFNTSGIGVALVGGKESKRTDKFSDNYTEAQRLALWDYIYMVRARYGDVKIRGHNEVSSKACPGFNVQEFLREGDPRKKKSKAPTPTETLVGGGIAVGAALAPENWPYALGVAVVAVVGFLIIRRMKR